MRFNAIDLFSGCGGLSLGLAWAGFKVYAAVEINSYAVKTYKLNHPNTKIFEMDIRELSVENIKKVLQDMPLHLLAGCPPCQGFSSIRRLNRKKAVNDPRNDLILEYMRFVRGLKPLTIMMENVPGLVDYDLFKEAFDELGELGYNPKYKIVDVSRYGVPQRRKRFIMIGSLLGPIDIPSGKDTKVTVRDVIGNLEPTDLSNDPLHKIYTHHKPRIQERIENIPKDGGSRKDLPSEYILECHKKVNVGFNDVYGRLKWDDLSSTITGGCLNPSKGRFLHPEENRGITAREAALLQTFPRDYQFPMDIPKTAISTMIGNALPPEFSRIQGEYIFKHLSDYYAGQI